MGQVLARVGRCLTDGGFGYMVGQIDPKWDKSGTFQIIFQYILT